MSRGASHLRMLTSSTGPIPCTRVLRRAHPVEQMIDEILEDGGIEFVDDLLTVTLRKNEPGIAERAEVARHGRPRRREVLGDLAGGFRSVAKEVQNLAPRRVGECPECIHTPQYLHN